MHNRFKRNKPWITWFLVIPVTLVFLSSCGGKITYVGKRTGDTEVVEAKEGKKVLYKLIYTHSGNKIIKGEYWEALEKTDKKEPKKPQKNIFTGSKIAEKIEKLLAGKKMIDESDINLDIEREGFVLKKVRKVAYNGRGLPERIISRGYTSIPFLGFFNIKTDWDYTYDGKGLLSTVKETNINVDSVLLNMAIGNFTNIQRDNFGRPYRVTKAIGSVPPSVEETKYEYFEKSNAMSHTEYKKSGISFKTLSVIPVEKVDVWYLRYKSKGKWMGTTWNGKSKYHFTPIVNFIGLRIWDYEANKNKLDISDFNKLNYVQKALALKNVADVLLNEAKGPKWRLGELADIPEPFIVYPPKEPKVKWWD